MRRLAAAVAALALAAGLITWRVRLSEAGRGGTGVVVPTVEVSRGPLTITLPLTGTLESAQETPVRAEVAGTLVEICRDNTPVKPGDFIFQLDTTDFLKQREDRVQELADAEETLARTKADSETRIAQAEAEVESAREALALAQDKAQAEREKAAAQVAYAEGELARAERELKRAQRLAELKYIPGTRLREAEKAYRREQFQLEQQRAALFEVENRTAEEVQDAETALALAVHALETAKADARAQVEDARIGVEEAKRRLAEVDKKISQCRATAPVAGLAVIQTNTSNWPERRPFRLGDRVDSGAAPVTIYDLTRMRVRCQVGEMDIPRIKRGQRAFVFARGSKRRFPGKVIVVEELGREANVWEGGTPGKQVFGLVVALEKTDPSLLRPGMSADLEVVVEHRPQATLVPVRAIFREGNETVVYRARGKGFERVRVEIAARNELYADVRRGVAPGDRVALERPGAAAGEGKR